MTTPPNIDSPYVNQSVWLPEDDVQRMVRLTDLLNEFGRAINLREIGTYENSEVLTGQQWININNNQNQDAYVPYRQIYPFTALVAPGATIIPHGITGPGGAADGLVFCTRIYGSACDVLATPTTFIPLPQAAPDDVNIVVDQVNITLNATTATYNGYFGFVVLEYLRT